MLQKIFSSWRTFLTRLLFPILNHDHETFEKIPLSKHRRTNSYMWIVSNFMLYFVVDLKAGSQLIWVNEELEALWA